MKTRTLIAGAAAGVAMFFWGMFSHMVLPLGEVGIQALPDEAAVTAVLKDKIKSPGLYLFPYSKDQAAMEKLMAERPRGILTFTSNETPFNMGASLGVQLMNDVICGLILAWLLGMVSSSLTTLGSKVSFAAGISLIGTVGYLGAFCNWYGFSAAYALAAGFDSIVAACIGAFVIAKIEK
jgi:hypothetical protein